MAKLHSPKCIEALKNQKRVKCPHCDLVGTAGSIYTHSKYMHRTTEVIAEIFWGRVNKAAAGGCWVWTGYRQKFGHGAMGYRDPVRGGRSVKTILAHRYSWELVNGPVPEGLCVLHRCDNPPCVNPEHLFLGTRSDNGKDMWRKGRGKSEGRRRKVRSVESGDSQR